MIKEQRDEAARIVEKVMLESDKKKSDYFLSVAAKDGTFLHYEKTGKFLNMDEMADCLKAGFLHPLVRQEYKADDISRLTCVISGNFTLEDEKEKDYGMVSAVFTKDKNNGTMFLSSMHISRNTSLVSMEKEIKEETVFSLTDTDGSLHVLSENDILYVHSSRNYLDIHTDKETKPIHIRCTLHAFREKLTGDFMPVGRSYIVNRNQIRVVTGNVLTLTNEECIAVSRNLRKTLKKEKRKK